MVIVVIVVIVEVSVFRGTNLQIQISENIISISARSKNSETSPVPFFCYMIEIIDALLDNTVRSSVVERLMPCPRCLDIHAPRPTLFTKVC